MVDNTVYLELPQPTVRLIVDINNSGVVAKDSQILSSFWQDENLTKKMQQEARLRILEGVREDGSLLREAKASGEEKLRILLGASGYKVVFAKYKPVKLINPNTLGQ